jgi:hypothetical protein
LPRFYRGWKPLPQGTHLLADKVALRTMTRYSAEVIIAEKGESRLKAESLSHKNAASSAMGRRRAPWKDD